MTTYDPGAIVQDADIEMMEMADQASHSHQTHVDPSRDDGRCVICGLAAPKPCRYGEQCAVHQAEIREWEAGE